MTKKFNKVIAVDGPAGSGKSTVARVLAQKLEALYVDTGAMYRAVTYKALQDKVDLDDDKSLTNLVKSIKISLERDKAGNIKVFLGKKDITKKLRSGKINRNISKIAKNSNVRKSLVKMQRAIGKSGGVIEGRDISTVVFPEAYKKFYLDANLEERIKRRFLQANKEGRSVKREIIKDEIISRDRNDRTRKIGALQIDPDATYVDTTSLSIDGVVQKLFDIIQEDK